jgi:hypothetical protein
MIQQGRARHDVLMAAIMAAASVGSAHAADWKGYAGVNCMSSDNTAEIRRSAAGQPAFANMGDTTFTAFCPVVRDDSVGGRSAATAAVRYRNRNSEVAVSCQFKSFDINGTLVDSASVAVPFGETTLSLGPVSAQNAGTYVLVCQLPGRDSSTHLPSYIIDYRVLEQ